jgi:DHA1 family tetracycline resistance protein-like MFS transporter
MLSNQLARLGRFLRSPLFPIFMIVFVDVLGLGITIPVLPLYAQNVFGASALQIALMSTAYFVAQFFAAPLLGRLSDQRGRRPVLIFSQAGTFLALLLSGLAPGLLFLYAARMIDGLTGGNVSVAQAYLSDITDEKNRARGLGIVNAGFSTGFLFGPAFGALVAAHFGPRVPFYIAAGVSLVTITLSTFLLPESLTPERRREHAARRAEHPPISRWALLAQPKVVLIMFIAFLGQFAFLHFQSTWVLWAEKVPLAGMSDQAVQQTVGLIFTFVGVFGIMTQFWLVGPLVRHFGERMLVTGGNLARGMAWGVMALVPVLLPIVLVMPLISVGGGLLGPALIALLTYSVAPGQRGEAIGLFESVQGLGRILGPILAGWLFERVNPAAPLAAAAMISGIALLASLGLWRAQRAVPPAEAA